MPAPDDGSCGRARPASSRAAAGGNLTQRPRVIVMHLLWRYSDPVTTKHVSLRLSPEMHSRLVAAAERNHRSLNGEIEEAVDRHLQREDLRGMVVHHKDGDRASLKLDNLEIRESGQ